jgi:hypothetical protein
MLVNSLPFSNICSANSFFGWPFSSSKAPFLGLALQSPDRQCVTPTYIGCLLASFLFHNNRNDMFVGKSCLHLSVLLLGGVYTKLEKF